MKTELKVTDSKLNIELKAGDKILVIVDGKKKGYIFRELSPHKEYRIREAKTGMNIVVGVNWFVNNGKKSYLWEEE